MDVTKSKRIIAGITGVLAVVGGLSGPWSAYTAYDASKHSQQFEEHEQVERSFKGEIASAEKHDTAVKVIRLRQQYEAYEEAWRAAREVVAMVKPIERLKTTKLTSQQSVRLGILLAKLSNSPVQPAITPKTLGAAYLALGEYDKAATHLNEATSDNQGDSEALALQAAAFSGLAARTHDSGRKATYETMAAKSYTRAAKKSRHTDQLSNFAGSESNLKTVLDTKGINIRIPRP